MTENKTKNSTNNKEIDDLDIEVQETSSAIKDNSEEKTVDKAEEGVVVPKSKIVLVKNTDEHQRKQRPASAVIIGFCY